MTLETIMVLEELLNILIKKRVLTSQEVRIMVQNATYKAKKKKEENEQQKTVFERQKQAIEDLEDDVIPFLNKTQQTKLTNTINKYIR